MTAALPPGSTGQLGLPDAAGALGRAGPGSAPPPSARPVGEGRGACAPGLARRRWPVPARAQVAVRGGPGTSPGPCPRFAASSRGVSAEWRSREERREGAGREQRALGWKPP